jgi:hypothetical protein
MLYKKFLVIVFIACAQLGFAQSENSSYFLDNTGIGLYLNPANIQEAKISWTLPSLYYVHGNRGPGIYSILKTNVLNLKDLYGTLKKNNSFQYGFQASLFGLSFNYDQFNFHIGQNLRSFTQVDYNNSLFDILINGNAQYIGETVNVGPYANLNFYNEFYAGFGVKLDNLNLGLRVKRLNGYANAHTPSHKFSIYTDEEIYQLKFNTEYRIHTNMYSDSLNFSNYTSQLFNNLTGNGGWAFDFGLKAKILDKFTISASLLDMGTIKWKNKPTKISTTGEYEFDGLDIAAILKDSLEFINLDSLGSIVNVEITEESYRSGLPVQFYLGVKYELTEQWEINGLFYNAYSTGQSHPSISVMGKYKPSEYFHTSFSYTWNPFAHVNIGWSAEAHLKFAHVYLAMDNIIDIFRPVGGNYFNVRTGIQIDLVK